MADKKFNLSRSIRTDIELNEQIDNVRVELPEKGVAGMIRNTHICNSWAISI